MIEQQAGRRKCWIGGLLILACGLVAPSHAGAQSLLPEEDLALPQQELDGNQTTVPDLDDEPALPAGLGGEVSTDGDEPALPAGLGGEVSADGDEPALPAGLGGGASTDARSGARDMSSTREAKGTTAVSVDLAAFVDRRLGVRLTEDATQERTSLDETRIQLALDVAFFRRYPLRLVADLIHDPVLADYGVDLERGRGVVDLREAVLTVPVAGFLDIEFGRQILTWGTADLLFLNDLFPKDWQAFLIGRDQAYLKAPSDAVRAGLYSRVANLDIVFIPRFDADRGITGERLSYYNPVLMEVAGQNAVIDARMPDEWLSDAEWHARLYGYLSSIELALYGYRGYWKSPAGLDLDTWQPTHPRLAVYGASGRAPWLGGIVNLEVAYYDSLDDPDGSDDALANSEGRGLVGYERSLPVITTDLTIAVQYYAEWLMDYSSYVDNRPLDAPVRDRVRHVLTMRITKLWWSQNLRFSIFGFVSPSDRDGYLRPSVEYRINDHLSAHAGGNLFYGRQIHTFFGQFEENSNIYGGLRYSF